jgi:RNA polymerase sigma-70 factor (ECF subfamily)
MNPKDDELIALIAHSALKDELAFKALYDRVAAYLNGVALRIVKSPEASNDVLQEAFIQIWQNASSYRPHLAKPLTWMTSIVRYRALDRLDKDKRLSNREVEGDSWLAEIAAEQNPEREVNHSQHLTHLLACMEQLTAKAKQAMTLAYVYGYSRVEIARELDTNTSTVKSWLRRGADKLRQCLRKRMIEKQ